MGAPTESDTRGRRSHVGVGEDANMRLHVRVGEAQAVAGGGRRGRKQMSRRLHVGGRRGGQHGATVLQFWAATANSELQYTTFGHPLPKMRYSTAVV